MSNFIRSGSEDSIPEVAFITNDSILADEPVPTPTEFKVKEANGELLPEPLLTGDKSRFVLFPIKHSDVSSLLRFFVVESSSSSFFLLISLFLILKIQILRSGRCTRKPKLHSGLPKKSI